MNDNKKKYDDLVSLGFSHEEALLRLPQGARAPAVGQLTAATVQPKRASRDGTRTQVVREMLSAGYPPSNVFRSMKQRGTPVARTYIYAVRKELRAEGVTVPSTPVKKIAKSTGLVRGELTARMKTIPGWATMDPTLLAQKLAVMGIRTTAKRIKRHRSFCSSAP